MRGVLNLRPHGVLKSHMMMGVSTMTRNGLRNCHTSGATWSELTKLRVKMVSDWVFWWNENQKKMTMPSTA